MSILDHGLFDSLLKKAVSDDVSSLIRDNTYKSE